MDKIFGDILIRIESLVEIENSLEVEKGSKFLTRAEEALDLIEFQLTKSKFIASQYNPTIADFCLLAIFMSLKTKSLKVVRNSNSQLFRWLIDLSKLTYVSKALGENWLSLITQSQKAIEPTTKKYNISKSSDGIAWLGSTKEKVTKEPILVSKERLPRLPAKNINVLETGVVWISSSLYGVNKNVSKNTK
eukprot:c20535_g1_i4.p1 GENE.c20535_g1_i4~~c20535_g1_i4.p1  ORF type:complete len:191 (+),score=45.74 c20535_g1_i4:260-832(+)